MENTTNNTPRLLKDTKKKIRVDYADKVSFGKRVQLRLTSSSFWIDRVWYLFRFLIMLGISYVILSPFFSRFTQSFMAREDFMNPTVSLIPKTLSMDIYKYIITENQYFRALGTTAALSLICAVLQTFTCCMVGYGLSKFKFKGKKIIFGLVIMTMIIPPSTLRIALIEHFNYFDLATIFGIAGDGWQMKGIIELITGDTLKLTGSFAPLVILSIIGCGFKNGLYIFMMMQFFKGVPDELEESAYVDGSGAFRTFIQIILPLSIPMMITLFLFSFSWQWTDEFYTTIFFPKSAVLDTVFLTDVYKIPKTIEAVSQNLGGQNLYHSAVRNTAGMLIIAPLILVYLFGQRYLVQGIERSGLVG